MKPQLNKTLLNKLPKELQVEPISREQAGAILHFGVGGFHRSHQALYFQKLIEKDSDKYGSWSIIGANILPQDKTFVDKMRQQDFLYTLKSTSSDGRQEIKLMSILTDILFGLSDAEQIINCIASSRTKLITFTITEGGYMIDEATGNFDIEHPDIIADLTGEGLPKTVFGYLARGLAKRQEAGEMDITLLSCDNIQENGLVLRKALLSFLELYDNDVRRYVEEKVVFPNCMVDRITPAVTQEHRDQFESEMGFKDNGLVISEDFCQWIIEKPVGPNFPPLEEVGVKMVSDVKPYEKMKLRVLNGGHSLVGLLGKALGYSYIHEAVKDEQISKVFDQYLKQEVIPSLDSIEGISFTRYSQSVKSRFGNDLIKDDTDRIISFSSAKLPKFILPVMEDGLKTERTTNISALIVAAWYIYLKKLVNTGRTQEITDALKNKWIELFSQSRDNSIEDFLQMKEVFGNLGRRKEVVENVKRLTSIIELSGMSKAIEVVSESDKK